MSTRQRGDSLTQLDEAVTLERRERFGIVGLVACRDRAERLGVAPEMIAMPAFAACAAVLDDAIKVQVRRHDQQWLESARLWVTLVEEPGGKKTPAINAAIAPLHDIEISWREEDVPKLDGYKLQQHLHDQKLKSRKPEDQLDLLFGGSNEPPGSLG